MLCSIAFIAALLPTFCEPARSVAVGYVEGEYVLVAPIETARVQNLQVSRGERAEVGQVLAQTEKRDAEIQVAQAEAALARVEAELADLKQGARAAEIAVAEAEVESSRTDLQEAQRELGRVDGLFQRNVVSQAQLDESGARRDIAEARLRESEARLSVLRLPARDDRIAAAEAARREAAAGLEAAKWRLQQRTLNAPVTGEIADIYRYPGDLAGPQAPVLAILPDGGIKLRFYVPQPEYALLSLGDTVSFDCDNCPADLQATISYLSTSPEFTPPVIYSIDTRQKLVYLAEAHFDASATGLKPGQIVDVRLPEPAR